MTWKTSWEGCLFICQREAFVRVAYEDGVWRSGPLEGKPKYSYGFGSQSTHPQPSDNIDIADAVELVRLHCYANDVLLAKHLKREIGQPEWDALASLYYQSGTAAMLQVTAALNNLPRSLAILEFAKFPFGEDKIPNDGLAHRRGLEIALAEGHFYGDLSSFMAYDGNPRLVTPYRMPAPAKPADA